MKPEASTKKHLRRLIVIMGVVIIVVLGYELVVSNSFKGCGGTVLGFEYWKLNSLGESLPSIAGVKKITGPTRGCHDRGFGKVLTVRYTFEAQSAVAYITAERQYQTILRSKNLQLIYDQDDQLYMAKNIGKKTDIAFIMVPIGENNTLSTLARIKASSGRYLYSVVIQNSAQ
jgi:hypothetical protein